MHSLCIVLQAMGKVDQELSPQTAASRMLEAALQQMDGILHGNADYFLLGAFLFPPRKPVNLWERLFAFITGFNEIFPSGLSDIVAH